MNWHKLKRWTLHLVMATISFDAFTQGQINFETAARVRNAQDGQTISDEGFLAQIFVGPNQDPGQMKAVGGVVLVGTDGQLLTPSPNPRTLPDSPPGTEVFAQIRVWNQNDNFSFDAVRDNGGWLGTSQIFRVRLETTATTPLPQDTEIHVRKTVGNLVEFGQIAFANRGSGLDVPFLGTDGKPLEGDNYLAQLFVGPSPELLNPIPEIRTFGTGINAGYLTGGTEIVSTPLVHPGQDAFLKIAVWHRDGGPTIENAILTRKPYGFSNVISVIAGGGNFPEWPVPLPLGLQPVWLEQIESPPQYGSIYFANQFVHPTLNTRMSFKVWMPGGTTPVDGPQFRARLYAGADPLDLNPIGWSKPFLSGPAAGLWEPEVKLLAGISPGAQVYAQVKVWDKSQSESYEEADEAGALRGESNVLFLTTGGGGEPPELPAVLNGLEDVVLYEGSAPVILTEPVSTAIIEGGRLSLQFSFEASEPYSIHWEYNGVPIPGSSSAVLTIPSTPLEMAGSYRAFVSNSAGSVSTSPVTVAVEKKIDPPVIVGVSGDQSVNKGQSATLEVTFTGTQPMKVDWYQNGSLILEDAGAKIVLGNLTAEFAGTYSVRLSNSAGNAETTIGTLEVIEPLSWAALPSGQKIKDGTPLVLRALAAGSDPITYKWTHNGSPLNLSGPEISIPSASDIHAGVYRVMASNPISEIVSPHINIEILKAPMITGQPAGINLAEGSTILLDVDAEGSSPLAFQWFRGGSPIAGMTTKRLEISQASEEHEGAYHVVVSNEAGEVISATAQVNIGNAPKITGMPQLVSFPAGHSALLWANVEGDTPIRYEWIWEGRVLMSTENPWTVLYDLPEKSIGTIQLMASNDFGSVNTDPYEPSILTGVNPPETDIPSVVRQLPENTSLGETFDVLLFIRNLKGNPIRIDEVVPEGLEILQVADGGTWDPDNRLLTWNLPVTDEILVHYKARPTIVPEIPLAFAGKIYFNDEVFDTEGDKVIGGFPSMPADIQPLDYNITFNEMRTFTDAYLQGIPWNNQPVTLQHAVRTVTIKNLGGKYTFDPTNPEPLSWIPRDSNFEDDFVTGTGDLLEPALFFVGQTNQENFVIQVIIDLPGRLAFASGLELNLSEGWSWDANSPDLTQARWIFPSAQQRKIIVDIFPTTPEIVRTIEIRGSVSYDGDLKPIGASATLINPLPNSIRGATIRNGKFVLTGFTELSGSWIIEKTDDFISWAPWKKFDSSTGPFEIEGEIEDVDQAFFRIRYYQDPNENAIPFSNP